MAIDFYPIWFDSLGAKSACTLVKTPDTSVLIDPGAAIMHPSFPASRLEKTRWVEEARLKIRQESRKVDLIIISHYHYDHFLQNLDAYKNKLLLVKDPNEYINDSQRTRAERFFDKLCTVYGNLKLESLLKEGEKKEFPDPVEELRIAKAKDFGDYARRRQELLKKGKKWFLNRVKNWKESRVIPEFKFRELEVRFADGKNFKFGNTRLKFTKPLFHGIEYSRVGWVFGITIEYEEEKLLYSSDLNGPIIEDYASWIVEQNPDILILDGPMTYMFGYLLNRINLNRAIENACRIVRDTNARLIIYDHHLPREAGFRERVEKVYQTAEKADKRIMTAAEYLGMKPKVLL